MQTNSKIYTCDYCNATVSIEDDNNDPLGWVSFEFTRAQHGNVQKYAQQQGDMCGECVQLHTPKLFLASLKPTPKPKKVKAPRRSAFLD